MKINDVQVGEIQIPLKKPFKTALREVRVLQNVVVKISTDTGHIGYGEAAITPVITGDIKGSIKGAILEHIGLKLIGKPIDEFEDLMETLHNSLVNNPSPKAAVDMALYDLYGQLYNIPVFKLLGGYRNEIITDITISVNEPEEMVQDSINAVEKGYKTLKIKVGKDWKKDLERLKAIRKAVGYDIKIRADANQGWRPKEAVMVIRKMEDLGLDMELIEQPVKAYDIDGLKFVTQNVITPILADESCFSPLDAINIIQNKAADMVNIKLMKTGGIYNALKICSIAETFGIECMLGCMLESKIGLTAASHLAGGKKAISKFDLDSPNLLSQDPITGGAEYDEYRINLLDKPGLGFDHIENVIYD
ncbi:dipeptide epimerase [Clostridium sp. Cult2]|uniref:dipeptide epimerase n=1 Tax=Clostridium sp. Cult2 TaxID=2079003 RepID=UPI001F1759DD|nr:dipeptide epimerase [Clostridium sp. Cult2]MCF6465767.1 dipeptide epimerase [Clostridium sp. Cult2]